ncbi:Major facilitator superfamily domain general substrate transporter [Penicillium hispanicum]|uniref:Major facilitator superfamily domain general substrate transporter n=1 Tax=Penicillium hispanicum TaxID=1080232 RepID=UPI002540D497|nr:Major facilitator superfamily domain general substrate transporter [Penicillium hispanicum]KAJ5579945.1 Major facilitator superfamily domain general substrate transporter [Penicillium hispanicum]
MALSESSNSSSMHDMEKNGTTAVSVADQNATLEYDRFLQLDNLFNGKPKAKLLRKLDARLLPVLSFLYLMCSLDKSNAGNAKLFGFLEDVGMAGTQYNLALMYFFFTYGLFEPVSNIMLRQVGPKIWFPLIVCAWGLITTLTSQVSSYGGFIVIRLMLGIAEAGLYPGAYFILSMWYTPKEIGTRMAIFYGANTTAGAFGGVIAYGVGSLDGNLGWRAWRWLFLIEGCITIFAGLCCTFGLPSFPHQYNEKRSTSWLTADELEYASLRVKYANGPLASTYTFRWSDVIAAAKDKKTYFMMMLFWWGGSVPTYSLSYTLPTMVANLGYTAVKAQALTTPPYIFATCVCVAVGYISDRQQSRYLCLMGAYILGLIGIIILWITVHHPSLPGVSYFAIFLAAAGYSAQAPIVGAWTSSNIPNPSKRAAAIGFLMLFGSVGGGSIGSNIYISSEAPVYPLGFGFSVGATVIGAMIPASIHWYLLKKENKRREGMDVGEIERTYSPEELGEMGEDSPLFRFVL